MGSFTTSYIIGDFSKGSPSVNLVDNRPETVQDLAEETEIESDTTAVPSEEAEIVSEVTQTNAMDVKTFLTTIQKDISWSLSPTYLLIASISYAIYYNKPYGIF